MIDCRIRHITTKYVPNSTVYISCRQKPTKLKGLIVMKGQKMLKFDIERGVSTIKDKNYHEHGGITRFSLQFFDKVQHLLTDVYMAELKFDKKHWYRLVISTKSGMKVSFHGCSFGYFGEGSRGTVEILSKLGFNDKQCRKAFEIRNHFDKPDMIRLFKRQ